jgi:uncharacterized protein with GYD domain
MPNYVALISWTEKGIGAYQDTVDRAGDFAQLAESLGGRVSQIFWTLGPYDLVGTLEAPDDETVTAIMLRLGSLGNVRTTTMRAFSDDEMRGIIGKAGG